MRWARWLLAHLARLNEVLVVNMDETRLDNQSQWQHGYHVKRRCQLAVGSEFVHAPTRESRCTLIAALCSNNALQGRLPQIILNKQKSADAAATARQPLQANTDVEWSNSTGAIDARTLARWVYSLRCVVDKHATTAWIILALDCCPVHVSLKFLRYCCRLGIVPLFLPARCTWFVQPLDVYVFGALKRKMAETRAAQRAGGPVAAAANATSRLSRQRAEVTAYLANADGPRALARCGMHLDSELWRGSLRSVVAGGDLKARPPTADELGVLLSRSSKQTARMLPLLLSWPNRLLNASVATPPPRAGLPVRRPLGPGHAAQGAREFAGAPETSSTRARVLPRGTRLGLPARSAQTIPAPAPPIGPAHGTRRQTAARQHGP